MKGNFNTQLGEIFIDPKVIATYAGSVAVECAGIVGMALVNMTQGVVRLLRRDAWTKGINVEVVDNRVFIDFHIIVSYGVNIPTVMDNLISNVKYKLEAFTGLSVEKINIFVEGVRVID